MRDLLLDLVLPKTDRSVFIQVGIAVVFWGVALIAVRNHRNELRQLVLGLAIMTLAWFAFRTIH